MTSMKAGLAATTRGVAFTGIALTGLLLAGLFVLSAALPGLALALGVAQRARHPLRDLFVVPALCIVAPLLIAVLLRLIRHLANLTRVLSAQWCGVPIASPYRSIPESRKRRLSTLGTLTEFATWRDLLWLLVNGTVGWIVVAAPAVMVVVGLFWVFRARGDSGPVAGMLFINSSLEFLIFGLLLLAGGIAAAPSLLKGYGQLTRSMLAPTETAALARRVEHLSQTRSETLDTGAAEIRRIERDLHDGAQARLVAMGMTLDAAGDLMDENPRAARALLIEARDSSQKALQELRALVRGIHPPVLADRGLAEAARALALDTPLAIEVASELTQRPPAPVESAAYFAVSELIANVSKHAHATQAWVDIRHAMGILKIAVNDNGQGGADPAQGTGLAGLERRLAAFDGVLAISSPPGGPTVVNVEIPCELR